MLKVARLKPCPDTNLTHRLKLGLILKRWLFEAFIPSPESPSANNRYQPLLVQPVQSFLGAREAFGEGKCRAVFLGCGLFVALFL